MILLVDIISYPEMCAERVVLRSASAPALSASAFFIIFFSKYARARSGADPDASSEGRVASREAHSATECASELSDSCCLQAIDSGARREQR